MVTRKNLVNAIKRLWKQLTLRRRRQFLALSIFMMFASIAEVVSIGSLLPFLALIASPELVMEHELAVPYIAKFDIRDPSQLLLPLVSIFVFATVVSCALRLLVHRALIRISFFTGADLGANIYQKTLYQSYLVHCSRSSSDVINGIAGKSNGIIYTTVVPILTLLNSSVTMLFLGVGLVLLNPLVTMIVFSGFAVVYTAIMISTRRRLADDGRIIASESTRVIKAIQEGLGGIRDVLLDGTQDKYCQDYKNADVPLRRAQARSSFVGASPKYFLEAAGMSAITLAAYVLSSSDDGMASAVPVLGTMALAAQRLLPISQQWYQSIAQLQTGFATLEDALGLLEQPLPVHVTRTQQQGQRKISFDSCLLLKNVGFSYPNTNTSALSAVTLKILKGERIGIIGTTGCGKSTLLDLIMGLLEPTEGGIYVDGIRLNESNIAEWQTLLSHVPQAIYLSDSSIEENIAFGVISKNSDPEKVRISAKIAQIHETIARMPSGYKTRVGERGVQLSGGQRQRLGIARAIYKRSELLILDEATSALDGETEQSVMDAIIKENSTVTLIIVAHRLSTLKQCDRIIELDGGRVKRVVQYHEL